MNADGSEVMFQQDRDPLLVTKLSRFGPLGARDRQALTRMLSLDVRTVSVRTTLQDKPDQERKLAVLLNGWACCFRQLSNGQRHLVACYLPGDVCDLHTLAAPRLDTFIVLMAGARVARLSGKSIAALDRSHPEITRALWLDAQVASSIEREWLVSVATRSARARIAHLLSEFACRSEAVGKLIEGRCDFPITQAEFANACGLTASHANRVLRLLHEERIATLSNTTLLVHDRTELARIAGFSPAYLAPAPEPLAGKRPALRMPCP